MLGGSWARSGGCNATRMDAFSLVDTRVTSTLLMDSFLDDGLELEEGN